MAKYFIGIFDGYTREYKSKVGFDKVTGLISNYKQGKENLNLIEIDQYFLSPKSDIDAVNDKLSLIKKIKENNYSFEVGDTLGIVRINKTDDSIYSEQIIYENIEILNYIGMLILSLKNELYSATEIKEKLKRDVHFLKYVNYIIDLLKSSEVNSGLSQSSLTKRTKHTMYDIHQLYDIDLFARKYSDNAEIEHKKRFLIDNLTSYKEFRNLANYINVLQNNHLIPKYEDEKLSELIEQYKFNLYSSEISYLNDSLNKYEKEIIEDCYTEEEDSYGIEEDDNKYHSGKHIR